MICKNCGASIGDHDIICPYCGYENAAEASLEHENELKHLHEMTEDVKNLKERTARNAEKKSSKIIWIIAGLFAVLAAAVYIVTAIHSDTALSRQQHQIEKLEAYYQAGEYEEMADYLYKCDNSYHMAFEKYSRTVSAYRTRNSYLEWLINEIKLSDMPGMNSLRNLSGCYMCVFEYLKRLSEYEEEGFPYDEGDAILMFKHEFTDVLMKEGCLTEAEINDGISRTDGTEQEDTYTDLAEATISRIKEKQ